MKVIKSGTVPSQRRSAGQFTGAAFGDVIHEPVVKIGLAGLGTWMFIGNMVMRRMIDMRL